MVGGGARFVAARALVGPNHAGHSGSQPAATSTSRAAASAPAPTGGVSVPAGYILIADDQVAVEVFGEDDLRTNGRLSPEGNLNLPLLGSIHLAGLTPTQAASRLIEAVPAVIIWSTRRSTLRLSATEAGALRFWAR